MSPTYPHDPPRGVDIRPAGRVHGALVLVERRCDRLIGMDLTVYSVTTRSLGTKTVVRFSVPDDEMARASMAIVKAYERAEQRVLSHIVEEHERLLIVGGSCQ